MNLKNYLLKLEYKSNEDFKGDDINPNVYSL